MSFFESLETVMDKTLTPLANKMNSSKVLNAVSGGMMGVMPVSLGIAAVCILGALPIPGWKEFMMSSGLYGLSMTVMMVTLSGLAIYIINTISYRYAANEGERGITASTLALASFLILIPLTRTETGFAIETKYIGSDGMFLAMVLAIVIAKAYCYLCKKNIKLRLPETVPPMVSNSLSPVFISMIILTAVFAVKFILTKTSYGNIFTLFNTLIAAPFMKFGATPGALLAINTFCAIMWFFGVHPSPVMSAYGVVMVAWGAANTEAFATGSPMPYLILPIMYLCMHFSGTGNTLGLTLCLQKAKSDRFKALKTVTLVPNFFNINEPVIFGVPVMLNPIFFIPMVLNTLIPGLIGLVFGKMVTGYNPTISLPWVTPSLFNALLSGGLPYLFLILVCIAVTTLIWYPFFKIADNNALKEEAAMNPAE